ncbi:sensor histidine kinase [Aneurinibacillus aneurinilyticus]|nr:sensor histidine kinase [Aneurinibacillus aneurinilyticus]MCI1692771.1 sensor histidine kinase [Aneurinibacillus aneurinilyticus]MED0668721.1 sensor histidine kinase [Aneurinibacillus aneurinilyticus]MED0708325.1 sensor histidine kinase [Aneurinibacillus aneurinilyticus]MED0722087.1 sensor histidine kinase [Aneurinibacillus aneurinilyticus]MED0733369.1 sensor histidine kinase [Aneurinibacillus aneurinilyticus]
MIDVLDTQHIRHLCQQYTSLTEEDIQIIVSKSEMLQMMADVSQANMFIDCPMKDRKAVIVVAEASPTTTHSIYKETVVGKEVFESYEPGVFRTYRTGKPALINRAVTQEGHHVKQNVVPIKNDKQQTIGMLILEQDITLQVKHEKELALLSETTQEFSRTFWDLIAKEQSIPDVIEEALLLLYEDGSILYANNSAIGLMELHSERTRENFLNAKVNEIFPFIEESDYLHDGVLQREVHNQGAVYILRSVCLQQKDKKRRLLVYLQDITDLRDKERQLMVKSAVIQEIHHRVKNNLQTVAGLLRLQMRRGVPDEAKGLYQECLNRIVSIATVHEVLSYNGIERVAMNQVIEKVARMLVYNMSSEECKVDIIMEIEEIALQSKQAVSLALILTELVQNCLKHGFVGRPSGIIRIEFRLTGDEIRLCVDDNGKGFEAQSATDQLGLEIVRNLTHFDLEGTFNIMQNVNGGTRASVSFPVEQGE